MTTNPENTPNTAPPIPPYPGADPAQGPQPAYTAPSYAAAPEQQAPPGYSGVPQGYTPPPVQQQPYSQPPQGYGAPYQQAPQYASPYPAQPGPYDQQRVSSEGQSAATLSLIFGIVGIFVFGFIFGPLAIWQASKAEKLGVPATAGKVFGWIDCVLVVLGVVVFGISMATRHY